MVFTWVLGGGADQLRLCGPGWLLGGAGAQPSQFQVYVSPAGVGLGLVKVTTEFWPEQTGVVAVKTGLGGAFTVTTAVETVEAQLVGGGPVTVKETV
jgi:hypothetical protein